MNILLLGSGGREHALAWKISQSPLLTQLFIAPGNAGTSECGTNISLAINDFDAIKNLCLERKVELLIVGPEEPLVNGIFDFFANDAQLKRIQVIGPSQEGAKLEGSKAYAKAFMQRQGIPTAAYREFTENAFEEAMEYVSDHAFPLVIKADGLAAGKGVIICQKLAEAEAALKDILVDSKFGKAGSSVVIEEFLDGIELSVFVLTDGENYVLLPEAKDYKRIGEKDTGLNTGGMGAISPVPFADKAFMRKITEQVIEPTILGLQKEHIVYKGFVFFGLIKVNKEPFVIEYNCRMGDPETEVVIPRMENDLVALCLAVHNKGLANIKMAISPLSACTIMAVSKNYPGEIEKGFPIQGLSNDQAPNSLLFHAGTIRAGEKVLTNGGRVLCATALHPELPKAVENAAAALSQISYEGMYFRKDIGYEFL